MSIGNIHIGTNARHFALAALLLFFFWCGDVHAATLSVVPHKTSVSVGDTMIVSVVVDSGGVAINSAEGSLSFVKSQFEVVSIHKDASLFPLWIDAPAYDGDSKISFNGGLPSPGYQGSGGTVFSVILRAKTAGVAGLTLVNGAVRANDGLGTNVLSGVLGANITVIQPVAPSAAPTPVSVPATSPKDSPAATPKKETAPSLPPVDADSRTVPYEQTDHRVPDGASVTEDLNKQSVISICISYFWRTLGYLLLSAVVLAVLGVILWPVWYLWNRLYALYWNRRGGAGRSRRVLHEQFSALADAVVEEVMTLQNGRAKKDLTDEKERVIANLKKIIKKTEAAVEDIMTRPRTKD